jgi:hypothetical protein
LARPQCYTPLVVDHWRWYWIERVSRLAAVLLPDFMHHRAHPANHNTPDKHRGAQYFTIIANRHSWSAELLGIWCHGPKGQRGQVPFGETHGNNVNLSSLSSSHIGTIGMATESLHVMINLYYCTLSKHVIEWARESSQPTNPLLAFLQQELKTYGSQES